MMRVPNGAPPGRRAGVSGLGGNVRARPRRSLGSGPGWGRLRPARTCQLAWPALRTAVAHPHGAARAYESTDAGKTPTHDPARPAPSLPAMAGYSDFRFIGSGGFSRVYTARQERFSRTVAVKVITVELSADALRRFGREQATAGRLDGHPHVIRAYESGFTEAGQPYLTMEYHERGSLADRLRREGPLPAARGAGHGGEAGVRARRRPSPGRGPPRRQAAERAGVAVRRPGAGRLRHRRGRRRPAQHAHRRGVHRPPRGPRGARRPPGHAVGRPLLPGLDALRAHHRRRARSRPTSDDGLLGLMRRVRSGAVPPVTRADVPPVVADGLVALLARDPQQRPPTGVAMAEHLRQLEAAAGWAQTPLVADVAPAAVGGRRRRHPRPPRRRPRPVPRRWRSGPPRRASARTAPHRGAGCDPPASPARRAVRRAAAVTPPAVAAPAHAAPARRGGRGDHHPPAGGPPARRAPPEAPGRGWRRPALAAGAAVARPGGRHGLVGARPRRHAGGRRRRSRHHRHRRHHGRRRRGRAAPCPSAGLDDAARPAAGRRRPAHDAVAGGVERRHRRHAPVGRPQRRPGRLRGVRVVRRARQRRPPGGRASSARASRRELTVAGLSLEHNYCFTVGVLGPSSQVTAYRNPEGRSYLCLDQTTR